jgi:hypothetical protein
MLIDHHYPIYSLKKDKIIGPLASIFNSTASYAVRMQIVEPLMGQLVD